MVENIGRLVTAATALFLPTTPALAEKAAQLTSLNGQNAGSAE